MGMTTAARTSITVAPAWIPIPARTKPHAMWSTSEALQNSLWSSSCGSMARLSLRGVPPLVGFGASSCASRLSMHLRSPRWPGARVDLGHTIQFQDEMRRPWSEPAQLGEWPETTTINLSRRSSRDPSNTNGSTRLTNGRSCVRKAAEVADGASRSSPAGIRPFVLTTRLRRRRQAGPGTPG